MNAAILTGGILGVGAVGILIYVAKSVAPVTKFLYANARIQSWNNYLIQEKQIDDLIHSKSLGDLTSNLRETDYIEELEKLSDKNNLKQFHKAIEKSFLAAIMELKSVSPDKANEVLDAYLGMLEAKVLKTFFRARFGGEELDEDGLVFPVGKITPGLLRHLLDTKTVADISVVMSTTHYAKLFEENYENVEQFDIAIEGFVLNNLVESIKNVKMHDAQAIIDIINAEIDLRNLLALLKFRVRELPAEKQMDLLIKSNSPLNNRLKALTASDSIKKLVELCKGHLFTEALENALAEYEKDDSLMHFEQNLLQTFKKNVVGNDLGHTLGPYPLFSYLIKKEIEMRNLFVISSGIANGFESERIKRLVI